MPSAAFQRRFYGQEEAAMSNRFLNTLAVFMVILMGLAAFAAGYLVRGEFGPLLTASRAPAETLAEEDFSLFWEAWQRIDENFIDVLPEPRRVVYGAIRGALGELRDPNTFFIEPPDREQERIELRGNVGGVGVTLARSEAGEVLLTPIQGNPAAEAGILPDDVLLAVDSEPVTADQSLSDIGNRIRGEKGTEVVLTIRHSGATQSEDITIERDDILIPSVAARLVGAGNDIGYVQLTRFSGESAGEVQRALDALLAEGATGLILDMRGNGGGLLDAAVDVADHFLDDGVVLIQESRGSANQTYRSTNETVAGALPLVVLIDGGTASAAEIVAGALRDRDRALLIGSGPTFGKGSVQLVFDLSDGSSVHVTSSRWYTPERQQLDGQGLQPDLVVTVSPADIENGRDAILNAAIDYLENGS